VSLGDIFQGLSDDETFVVVRVVEGVEIQELLILPWHYGAELLLQETLSWVVSSSPWTRRTLVLDRKSQHFNLGVRREPECPNH